MKLKRICVNCIWHDSCNENHVCNDFAVGNDEYIKTEYKTDQQMRENEYQCYINEITGDA